MEIRTATDSDLHELYGHYCKFIRDMFDSTGDPYFVVRGDLPTEKIYKRHLRQYIRGKDSRVLVAVENDMIAGFLACELTRCYFPVSEVRKIGYVSMAYVAPENRRGGMMTALENAAIEWFRDRGAEYAELNYLTANELAVKTWTNLGYEVFRVQARKKL